MSYTSAVVFSLPPARLPPLHRALQTAGCLLTGVLHAVAFAMALYIVAAGPGFLCDRASTVPAAHSAGR